MLTGSPSNRISPLSAACVPATHLMSVDLPAPLSPTSAITSPSRTSKSTSVSACTDPYDFVIPRSWSSGGDSLIAGCVPTTKRVEAPTGAPTPYVTGRLLAVLLVLAVADLAPLQPPIPEEP